MVRLWVLLLLNVWVLGAIAEQQPDNYRVEMLVPNQSDAERNSATKTALSKVLVSVSGNVAVLEHPLVLQAMEVAPNYLLQFNYAFDRDNKSPDGAKLAGVKLTLNYSPQLIEKLLRDAELLQKPGQQDVVIQISNVNDFATFKQVQAYIKSVGVIRRSKVLMTNRDVLTFNVSLDGDVEVLKSTLELNASLHFLETIATAAQTVQAQQPQLNFRWQQ